MVGAGTALQISRGVLAQVAELPVASLSDQEYRRCLQQDILTLLAQQDKPEAAAATPAAKRRRDKESESQSLRDKTLEVWYCIENRVALRRYQETVAGAVALTSKLSRGSSLSSVEDADAGEQDPLHGRHSLARHLLTLDGAMDRWASERIFTLRGQGLLAGCALATDESPPSQPRYRGLRFQITVLFVGSFKPPELWESSDVPPIHRQSVLADIMHCPGKRGGDVVKILGMQLARQGLSPLDVVSCTGDGGGENEGKHGVHAHFEELRQGYVRRRCLPHLAWRTCDAALRASGLQYKSLATYLCEGVTWTTLQAIAVKPRDEGGLALFREGSQEFADAFSAKPSTIIDGRPETDLAFLQFLQGKEEVLRRAAARDMEQRALRGEAVAAAADLGKPALRISRAILVEVLNRCMLLKRWQDKHRWVAAASTWDGLVDRCTLAITNLDITDEASHSPFFDKRAAQPVTKQ